MSLMGELWVSNVRNLEKKCRCNASVANIVPHSSSPPASVVQCGSRWGHISSNHQHPCREWEGCQNTTGEHHPTQLHARNKLPENCKQMMDEMWFAQFPSSQCGPLWQQVGPYFQQPPTSLQGVGGLSKHNWRTSQNTNFMQEIGCWRIVKWNGME